MPSQHADPVWTVRIPRATLADAKAVLRARGVGIKAFATACCRALVADPGAFLATLAPHWPNQPDVVVAEPAPQQPRETWWL